MFPKRRGPQYRPQNTIVLIIGTPKKAPLILAVFCQLRGAVSDATKDEMGRIGGRWATWGLGYLIRVKGIM